MDPLIHTIRKVRLRLTIIQWIELTVRGLMAATCAACLWLVVTRLFPQLGDHAIPGAVLLLLGFLFGIVGAMAWRPSMLRSALAADGHLGLKERVTSSYELADRKDGMFAALHEDARNVVNSIHLGKAFPVHPPRLARWLAVALAVYGLGALFLPEFDLLGYREMQEQIQKQTQAKRVFADRLRNSARPLRDENDPEVGDLAAMAEAVERIAEAVEMGELTEKQAVAKLSDVAADMASEREQLAAKTPAPNLRGDTSELGAMAGIADDMENGRFDDAAEKLAEMKEKLESGAMSAEDAQSLAADMKKMADMLGGENTALGEALAKAATGLSAGNMSQMDMGQALKAMEGMQASLGDMASMMAQMEAMDSAMNGFGEAQSELLGRQLAEQFAGQGFQPGQGWGESNGGLGGPGRGRGNQIGDLPDTEGALEESMLPGDMTQGKILASIMQRAAPDGDEQSTIEFKTEALVQIQAQAEQALTKEEIPPGAKEFVKNYFGSLEPDRRGPVARPKPVEE
ncbi:MAG: hypothetical protein GY851_12660 [bacterium]|nr:hypothetical protein [bacterium]